MKKSLFCLVICASLMSSLASANRIASQGELSMMNLPNSYNCLLQINDLNGKLVSSSVRVAGRGSSNVNAPASHMSMVEVVESATSGLYVHYVVVGNKKGKAVLAVQRVLGTVMDSRTPMGWYVTRLDSVEPVADFTLKGSQEKLVETSDYKISLKCVNNK